MDTDTDTDTDTIDALLERYLSLLDEYTNLRTKLGQLQTGMFQHLARANFSAERGMRYGPDFYDERMQATRRVIPSLESDVAVFRVVTCDELSSSSSSSSSDTTGNTPSNPVSDLPAAAKAEKSDEAGSVSEDKVEKGEGSKKQRSKDPLRWFGVLTPLALRQTQGCAIEVVEQVIPKLVSVSAAMQDVEIQVRRARKKRAKAEAATAKKHDAEQHQEGLREEVAVS
ncbi:hypothetical protein VP1G_07948 [Cytospora mali]|uniref:Vacuolar ATPase assembly protein VMA22 n=1 Tax=Cytospora mali TaxID=578113 RepID=A0A194VAA5_CYTMA|nr:hypothetical protein VP1G_07948 [Valsa mali var. pyri (nom. inval.)]